MKSFLIVGMGSFGHHLCRELAKEKCEIMIVDRESEKLEDMLPYVVSAKVGDCTNPAVLKSFGVEEFDACFVCIGGDFQSSLEVTCSLKELGAKKVYSKADEDIQAKFLLRNGADEVIYPEKDVARRLAVSESSDSIFDCIDLSDGYSVYEIEPHPKWVGNSMPLDFRKKYNLNILAVKKDGKIRPFSGPSYVFKKEEHLLVMGHIDDIRKVVTR